MGFLAVFSCGAGAVAAGVLFNLSPLSKRTREKEREKGKEREREREREREKKRERKRERERERERKRERERERGGGERESVEFSSFFVVFPCARVIGRWRSALPATKRDSPRCFGKRLAAIIN